MNLLHYFDAINFTEFSGDISYNWKFSLGATIEKHTLKLHDGNVKNVEMAIVGVPFDTCNNECTISNVPNQIRKELYQLTSLGKINIIDFGNLKQAKSQKGNYLSLRDVIDYLNELGVTTLVLGGSQDFSYGVCQAYRNNKFFSFCAIDAYLDVKKGKETFNPYNYLSRVFTTQPNIFQFSLLGYQSHLVAREYFTKTRGVNHHIRLGLLRKDLSLADPVFRNSDFLTFDLGTLKHAEAPGRYKLPNGLHSEDACQLAKYAGLSNRLQVFGLFGIDAKVEGVEITIKLAAQVAWYFIQGFLQRNTLKPEDKNGFTVHKVEIAELNHPLSFYKNTETKQWWLEVNSIANKANYIACSEKDYLDASHNEIPEFWLKYIQKIDELLK